MTKDAKKAKTKAAPRHLHPAVLVALVLLALTAAAYTLIMVHQAFAARFVPGPDARPLRLIFDAGGYESTARLTAAILLAVAVVVFAALPRGERTQTFAELLREIPWPTALAVLAATALWFHAFPALYLYASGVPQSALPVLREFPAAAFEVRQVLSNTPEEALPPWAFRLGGVVLVSPGTSAPKTAHVTTLPAYVVIHKARAFAVGVVLAGLVLALGIRARLRGREDLAALGAFAVLLLAANVASVHWAGTLSRHSNALVVPPEQVARYRAELDPHLSVIALAGERAWLAANDPGALPVLEAAARDGGGTLVALNFDDRVFVFAAFLAFALGLLVRAVVPIPCRPRQAEGQVPGARPESGA